MEKKVKEKTVIGRNTERIGSRNSAVKPFLERLQISKRIALEGNGNARGSKRTLEVTNYSLLTKKKKPGELKARDRTGREKEEMKEETRGGEEEGKKGKRDSCKKSSRMTHR